MNYGTLLKVPRGTPDLAPMELELGEIAAIERRKIEVAVVNKETAPELMMMFNNAYCDVLRYMSQVSFEYNMAVKYANKRKAVVNLDVAPEIFKQKNLKSSEDLRNSVLALDEEFLALQDKVYMLEAVYEFLKAKAKGFEMAYHSVKKIYDVTNSSLGDTQHRLSGGIKENLTSPYEYVGEPRY